MLAVLGKPLPLFLTEHDGHALFAFVAPVSCVYSHQSTNSSCFMGTTDLIRKSLFLTHLTLSSITSGPWPTYQRKSQLSQRRYRINAKGPSSTGLVADHSALFVAANGAGKLCDVLAWSSHQ